MGVNSAFTAELPALEKVFKKCDLLIGTKKISAYIADDDPKRERGLMFVKHLDENSGMLFVFEETRPLGFWMKNTVIPLSIGFFDAKARLDDIQEMAVADSIMVERPPSYQSRAPALYALEMNTGWYSRAKISKRAQITVKGRCDSDLLTKHLRSSQNPRR
jgi:uncharacterized membrane protein (UPF0127 family)